MKKLLIGTTALVAVGMAADGALAAEKINLGLGGYWRGFFVVGDQDSNISGKHDHGISREGEVFFQGSTTLDNGLKVGVKVELEAETSGDQIDTSYITFGGGFGTVFVGSFWGPGVAMHYANAGDQLSGWGDFASHQVATDPTGNSAGASFISYAYRAANNDQIAYYTPRIMGFQAGVGYMPNAQEESAAALSADNSGAVSQIWQAGVNYQQTFNDVGIGLSAVYEEGNREQGASALGDQKAWALGAYATFAGVKVGASYKHDNPNSTAVDPTTWTLGASYGMGAFNVGLSYAKVDADTSDNDEMTYLALTGNYALGPGVSLQAGIQRFNWDSDTANQDGTSNVFIVGTKLDF
jgi:hypothetical protein